MKYFLLLSLSLWGFILSSSAQVRVDTAQTHATARLPSRAPRSTLWLGATSYLSSGTGFLHHLYCDAALWESAKQRTRLGVRAGTWIGGDYANERSVFSWDEAMFPIAAMLQIGKTAHQFELALGPAFTLDWAYFPILPYLDVSYLYQPVRGGLSWRVHVGTPGLGASVGWAF